MRWQGERQSGNIEDRRGMRPGGMMIGGGAGLVVVIVALLLGVNPLTLLNQVSLSTDSQQQVSPAAPTAQDDQQKQFVAAVLAETEDVWQEQFQNMGRTYQDPTLVLFTDQVESACGLSSAAVGPFYCPQDGKVYLDLTFFDMLQQRFQAPGDFAEAYVIAHEVGHHVQDLLGISAKVEAARERLSEAEYNQLSVRLELQADFFAGVWAHHTQRMKKVIEEGDIEEAINAAAAIGDDRLQMQTQGRVMPDAFTHGTSEQRVRWFRLGYETGDMRRGDTFNADRL
jgi:predicted metalloprotease